MELLKIITRTAQAAYYVNAAKHARDQHSILVQFNNFALTMGFY